MVNELPTYSALKRTDLLVDWALLPGLQPYESTQALMEQKAEAVARGQARECVWLLEHPAIYTAGTSANLRDVLPHAPFPVLPTNRGGQITYHGPGQRVAYVMLNLRERGGDIRQAVRALEAWLIGTLAAFCVQGEQRKDRVGVWVRRPERGIDCDDKIAALGLRVRHGVTFHGISLNVEPDLSHFDYIVPCGVREHGVTSLVDLGLPVTMDDVDMALRTNFERLFGPTVLADSL